MLSAPVVVRDVFLLSDPLDLEPSIDSVDRGADGSAVVGLLDRTPLTVQPRIGDVTDYVITPDGEVVEAAVETVALFSREVELTNGNRVAIDEDNDAITLTLSDADGNPLQSRVLDTTEISFAEEAVAALPGGGFVASWLDSETSPFLGAVKLQFFTGDGLALSGPVIAGGSDGQTLSSDQQVFVTPSGGVGVIWEQAGTDGLLYQAFDAAGATTVAETELGIDPGNSEATLSYRADGSFLVAAPNGQINLFDADGIAVFDQTADLTTEGNALLAAALLSDGFAVVTSVQQDSLEIESGAVVTVYSDAGDVVGEPVPLSGFASQFIGSDVEIAVLADGGFAVIWQQSGSFFGAEDPVLAQVFATNGDVPVENRAPVITSATALALDENSTDPVVIEAQDPDGDPLTFSVAGGDDASLFEIDAQTGALSFTVAQDFEAPTDLDSDGVYDVSVNVADGQGGSETLAFSVTLLNVAEGATGAANPDAYDAVYLFDNANNTLFPQRLADDFAAGLGTNDYIDAGGGNDSVRGGGGDDYIIAGSGFDYLIVGNAGRDIFRFGEGDDDVRIRDFTPGEDLIHLAGGLTLADLSVQSFTQSSGAPAFRYITEGGARLIIDGLVDGLSEADLLTDGSPLPRNFAPIIEAELEGAGVIDENTVAIASLEIGDANETAGALDLSLSGADAGHIQLTESALRFGILSTDLTFIDAPDFEAPADADGDNIYEVTVTATDSGGQMTSTDLAITVSDVADGLPSDFDETFDAIVTGTDAADTLRGTEGRDYIMGGGGSDVIFAGGGADVIDAGSGLDFRVYGGGGADLFVFDEDSDRIRVLNFELGQDKILLGEGVDFADLVIHDWSTVRQLDDGSIESSGGINIIYAADDGSENRFSIAIDGRAPSADEIGAEDFVTASAVLLPELDLLG